MKLSERLETLVRNACPGWHAAETIREAAALARRVEGAAVVEMPSRPGPALQGGSLVIGTEAAERMGLAGQRVRLVPDSPTPPDPGHEQVSDWSQE